MKNTLSFFFQNLNKVTVVYFFRSVIGMANDIFIYKSPSHKEFSNLIPVSCLIDLFLIENWKIASVHQSYVFSFFSSSEFNTLSIRLARLTNSFFFKADPKEV